MRICVYGTGGVGGYFGGRLAQAGEDVVFIARGKHMQAMQKHGLHISSINGDIEINPVHVRESPVETGQFDVVLLCVKAWQVAEILDKVRLVVGPNTLVIPLENGVNTLELLQQELKEGVVAGGTCWISSFVASPGQIKHVGVEPKIAFGALDGRNKKQVYALRMAFERVGVHAYVPADILSVMWEKYIFITPASGLGAVTNAAIGTIREIPETRKMLVQAVKEVITLGFARGVKLPADILQRTLGFVDSAPSSMTASLQRDIAAGKPSELETLIGAVVRDGKAYGVQVPVHTFIYGSLLPQEIKARKKIQNRKRLE